MLYIQRKEKKQMKPTNEELSNAYTEAYQAYKKYKIKETEYKEAMRVWIEAKSRYEHLDYQAALEDGRFKKVGGRKTKDVKVGDLSEDDLLTIAEKLGVKI